jgi:hypothetical protein
MNQSWKKFTELFLLACQLQWMTQSIQAELSKFIFIRKEYGLCIDFIHPNVKTEHQETDEFFLAEIPSILLEITPNSTADPKFEVIRMLDECQDKILSSFFMVGALMRH